MVYNQYVGRGEGGVELREQGQLYPDFRLVVVPQRIRERYRKIDSTVTVETGDVREELFVPLGHYYLLSSVVERRVLGIYRRGVE